eukprot:112552-Rhodomonas_salina.1
MYRDRSVLSKLHWLLQLAARKHNGRKPANGCDVRGAKSAAFRSFLVSPPFSGHERRRRMHGCSDRKKKTKRRRDSEENCRGEGWRARGRE